MSNESPQLQLSNLLHANTSNIPGGLYIKIQDLLKKINGNTPSVSKNDTGYDNVKVSHTEFGMGYDWS